MMRSRAAQVVLAAALAFGAGLREARAQSLLAVSDDVILITKGQTKKRQAGMNQHAGASVSAFPDSPGADVPRLGAPYVPVQLPSSIATAAAQSGSPPPGVRPLQIVPAAQPAAQVLPPLYGTLDISATEDEGPPNGLTLDAAIDHLVRTNYDLLTKYQEIPKAQADILSAGLRLNPFLFATADNVPYGSYSPQRPGSNGYSFTVAQPIDFNQKRKLRVRVAQEAKQVLEAQYQNAVRLAIDNLYTAFVDVLEARQAARLAGIGVQGIAEVVKTTRALAARGQLPKSEIDRVLIQQYRAGLALQAAQRLYRQAKQNLATLLAIPPEEADAIELRGKLHDGIDLNATRAELINLATGVRPDLTAYRLGVQRAQQAVQLATAERFEDVFLFYTPYNFTNNGPVGGQNTTSWSAGILLPLPIFNRNQGNITRARANVTQTQYELAGIERRIANEVQRAVDEYQAARLAVRQFEENIIPAGRRLRDSKYQLFIRGQEGLIGFLAAQSEHNDLVRQYLEALVRQRRAALFLNTVVGQRVQP